MDVDLQARIDAIRWYHEFDFGNGLKARSKTKDADAHRRVWRFIEDELDAIDFRGKTVLDIGCWDGYWSFYAEKRGAKSVLATDDFSQNWSGADGVLLAKQLLGSQIEINPRLNVYNLASLNRQFDIVLFLGVFYHLFDPFYALAQIRHCCQAGSIVCVEGSKANGVPANTAVFNPDARQSKFLPSMDHLEHMLHATYMPATKTAALPLLTPPPGRLGWKWRLSMCLKALRGSRAGVKEQVEPLSKVGAQRVFLACTAVEEENAAHEYCPPFGLHRYDPRFRGNDGVIAQAG